MCNGSERERNISTIFLVLCSEEKTKYPMNVITRRREKVITVIKTEASSSKYVRKQSVLLQ